MYARFFEANGGIVCYLPADIGNALADYKYIRPSIRGKYMVLEAMNGKATGCIGLHGYPTGTAKNFWAGRFFGNGDISRSVLGKKLKIKKMKTDSGFSFVICLNEEA